MPRAQSRNEAILALLHPALGLIDRSTQVANRIQEAFFRGEWPLTPETCHDLTANMKDLLTYIEALQSELPHPTHPGVSNHDN